MVILRIHRLTLTPSLTTILLLGLGFVQYSSAECKNNLGAEGSPGDTVQFTLCVIGRGDQNPYMMVEEGKKPRLNIHKDRMMGDWFWTWKSLNRVEALVNFTIPDQFNFDSPITLKLSRTDETWKSFIVRIRNNLVHIEVRRKPGNFDKVSTLSSSSTTWTRPHTTTSSTDRVIKETSEPPFNDVDGIVLIFAIAGVIILFIVLTLVVFIFCKKRASDYKRKHKQPQVRQAHEINEEEETMLSNPVYGMSKDLGGQ